MIYKTCEHPETEIIKVGGPHYAKEVCVECGTHIKWVKNPDKKQKKRKNTSVHSINSVLSYYNLDKKRCFFCGREKIGFNETFTIDHVYELQDGGTDDLKNLQILCTACHSLKNWVRIYLNIHNIQGLY